MIIKTSDPKSIKPFVENFYIPSKNSHKGQNGKLLIIGGSQLFHAASLWAAETASYIVDMVHYSSTVENNEILLSLKKKFRNGMIIYENEIPEYLNEDDVCLVGPGMVRTTQRIESSKTYNLTKIRNFVGIEKEGIKTYYMTKFLLQNFPEKKFVIDAGALQMMQIEWLKKRKARAILTPHQQEFKTLFGVDVSRLSKEAKAKEVVKAAKKNNCVILLKSGVDIVSDGEKTYFIEGGNAGLTKGGSGDVLGALVASFYTRNDELTSCIMASYVIKKAAEKLFFRYGYWYNTSTVIRTIPRILFAVYKSV